MKKIIICFVFVFLLIRTDSFATSGACSYHGGVTCSTIGVYATCKDGTKSSIFYSDIEECKSYNQCRYPSMTCTVEQITFLQSQKSSALSSYRGMGYTPENPTAEIDAKIAQCQSQINTYNQAKQEYDRCQADQRRTIIENDLKKVSTEPTKTESSGSICSVTQEEHDKVNKEVLELTKKLSQEAYENFRETVDAVMSGQEPPNDLVSKIEMEHQEEELEKLNKVLDCEIIKPSVASVPPVAPVLVLPTPPPVSVKKTTVSPVVKPKIEPIKITSEETVPTIVVSAIPETIVVDPVTVPEPVPSKVTFWQKLFSKIKFW